LSAHSPPSPERDPVAAVGAGDPDVVGAGEADVLAEADGLHLRKPLLEAVDGAVGGAVVDDDRPRGLERLVGDRLEAALQKSPS
jgi:hypothetical protein